ncbi:MAG TPA: L-aspartate oxidase [Longimicrobiales bacterium]|nr:L-aspartate oxidase [Longimicrobiales bacterium]
MSVHRSGVLVIGSGIAGLSFALKVADSTDVTLITKKHRFHSNTNYAQGGIAAVMSPDDTFSSHVADTLRSGAGLCDETAVRNLVEEGPDRIRELMDWGVAFTRREGTLSLGREGGHSNRRIVHADDLTGREIERALLEAAELHPGIQILEDHEAVELIVTGEPGALRCAGADVLRVKTGEVEPFYARFTLLATGGLGRVYLHTTNPEIATGDGVAMAFRAGATVANLEFVQFHPTALYPAEGRAVLISEAVRGEGAVLRTLEGEPVVRSDPLGSLATRDVVAREIDRVLKETGAPHVWLDLSPIPTETIERRFPNILAACAERGIDIRTQPIPVVPAAHYSCGGVRTDHEGRTDVDRLYAAGEVACTGVHGANRLASNSLLEAVVYSHRAAQDVLERLQDREVPTDAGVRPAYGGSADPSTGDWQAIQDDVRTLMWTDAGIVRSDARLERAEQRLRQLHERVLDGFARERPHITALATRNLVQTALLVVRCARWRKESRGLQHNVDWPQADERYRVDTALRADGGDAVAAAPRRPA